MIGRPLIPPWPTARRRTLPYMSLRMRRRRTTRSPRAPRAPSVNNGETMIFDQPPAELPVATLRTRALETRLWLEVRGWLASKWRWLRPRSIPVAAAFAGMLGVLASASYLRELAHRQPEQLSVHVRAMAPRPADHAGRIKIETRPSGAGMFLDGKPWLLVANHGGEPKLIKLEPGIYKVELQVDR